MTIWVAIVEVIQPNEVIAYLILYFSTDFDYLIFL